MPTISPALARRLGIKIPPKQAKYASSWTMLLNRQLHTTGRDCPLANPNLCTICKDGSPYRAQRQDWYQSRTEARYARWLMAEQDAGRVLRWRRGKQVTLLDAENYRDRIKYTPDFEVVWTAAPDASIAYEIKGAPEMISQPSKMRIKMYRAAVLKDPKLPPLKLMRPLRNGDWAEFNI